MGARPSRDVIPRRDLRRSDYAFAGCEHAWAEQPGRYEKSYCSSEVFGNCPFPGHYHYGSARPSGVFCALCGMARADWQDRRNTRAGGAVCVLIALGVIFALLTARGWL